MKRRVRFIPRPSVTDGTQEIGFGPLTFNAKAAREAGWTEKMINRAYDALVPIVRKESALAKRRRPDLYRTSEDGTTIFVGAIDGQPALTREQRLLLKLKPGKRGRRGAKWAPHPNCIARTHNGNAPCVCIPPWNLPERRR